MDPKLGPLMHLRYDRNGMTLVDLRPLTLGEILDRTFTLFRRHFVLWIGITAIPQLIALAFQLLRTFAVGPGTAAVTSLTLILVSLAVFLIAYVASLFAQGATFFAVGDLYLSRPVSVANCLRRAWSEIGTVFAVGLLNGLAILAGAIALIIPGIYIGCRLIVSVPAALIEQRGPSEALGRSWRLTKDNAGRAFVMVLLYLVIVFAAVMIVQAPFMIAIAFSKGNYAMLQLWTVLMQVGNALVNIVVSPILLIATSIFYFDLRVRKEAFDLQFMMDPTSERMTPPGAGSVPSILP